MDSHATPIEGADLPTLHPRPSLTRSWWGDLCGEWAFAYDDENVGVDTGWSLRPDVFDRTITVPFPPESPASGIGDTGFHPVVWYRRRFTSPLKDGQRVLLHFGAVDYRASVWVNGHLVATHEGGHTPFSADVTAALRPGGPDDQVLVVRAEDPPRDVSQPRGKQDWQERPHKIWYERTTGIWQPVWLEAVPAVHIASVTWTPDLARRVVRTRILINGQTSPDTRVRVRLRLGEETLADDTYAVVNGVAQRDIALEGARIAHERRTYLWAPEHPNLVDAELTLLHGESDGDRVGSYLGLRDVSTGGGHFVLNGRPYVLRMVLSQGYWPESHLAAPSADALRREVQLVKDLGFNGVRIHQKVEDPRFLYWCDRLGVLAWGEMPSPRDFGAETMRRLTAEWLEVVKRDASSPALVTWVPFNESWGVPELSRDPAQQHAVRALYHLTKSVDPSRPVIGNDGWEHSLSDIFGVHDYSSDAGTLRERYGSRDAVRRTMTEVQPYYRRLVLPDAGLADEPLVVTEFGGITHDPESDDFWNGYGSASSGEELLKKYGELVRALLDSPVVAGFCYTQLTDTGQERNGLLDGHRRPKVDVAALAAVNRLPSAAVPADAIAEIQLVHAQSRTRRDGES